MVDEGGSVRLLLVSAFALVAALSSPAWAQQTTNVAVTYSAWTDLGTGPLLLVGHGEGRASYAVATTTPALAPELGFPVQVDRAVFVNSKTSDHIWVRAINSLACSVTYTADVVGP